MVTYDVIQIGFPPVRREKTRHILIVGLPNAPRKTLCGIVPKFAFISLSRRWRTEITCRNCKRSQRFAEAVKQLETTL